MSVYEDTQARLMDALKSDGPRLTSKDIQQLSEQELNIMFYGAWGLSKRLRSLRAQLKEERIHRANDYLKMVKEARKRFTDDDCKILQFLAPYDESAWYARGIADHTELNIKTVEASLKKLRRRGLVEVQSGLFDDDGMVAGSGYAIVDRHRGVVEQILEVFENHQEAML